jgi:DNA-binding transcriptional LysR family regulator
MELRHLRYFVAIAEEHSFTRAAERLWVAQPGLSTQIRRLESELGVTLFERHSRGVDLTDVGEVFLERARAVLTAADEARAVGSDLQSGLVGSVRLGIASGAGWSMTPTLLERFGEDRPDVELTVVESFGGTLLRDLRDGRLDALIAPAVYRSPDARRLSLGGEPWAVLVGLGHRLAGSAPIEASELHGEQVVVTGHRDGAVYDRAVADLLAELGVTAGLRRGGPGPALLSAVGDGEAIALSTRAGAAGSELLVRDVEPTRHVQFEMYSRDETPAPALAELIRAAEALAEPAPQTTTPMLVAVA